VERCSSIHDPLQVSRFHVGVGHECALYRRRWLDH
jgi:hypothetical protein